MKIQPTLLFLLLTLVGLVLLTQSVPVALIIVCLSGLTSLCYFIMSKLGKSISNSTGYWHFGLITLGLLFSISIFRIFTTLYNSSSPPDSVAFASDISFPITATIGLLLLLTGLVVFIVGLFRAIRQK